jgi:protein TonB
MRRIAMLQQGRRATHDEADRAERDDDAGNAPLWQARSTTSRRSGAWRFTTRMQRRWRTALAASLALHAATAAAVMWVAPHAGIQLLSPRAGRASIALTATIAAEAEPLVPEIEIAARREEAPPQWDEAPESPPQSETALAAQEAIEPQTAPRLFEPTEPVVVVVEESSTPVVMGGQAERPTASLEIPPPVAERSTAPALARRQFAMRLETPSAASLPSPASEARSGVESDAPPQAVVNPPPVYPADALAAGRTGRVVIRAEVAADGHVREARVHRSSGVTSLDAAALDAVRGWRFSAAPPAAPPRRVNVPIEFVIRR